MNININGHSAKFSLVNAEKAKSRIPTPSPVLKASEKTALTSIHQSYSHPPSNLAKRSFQVFPSDPRMSQIFQHSLSPIVAHRPPPAALTEPSEILNATLRDQLQPSQAELLNKSSLENMMLEGTPPPPATGAALLPAGNALDALPSGPIVDATTMYQILQKPSERLKEELKDAVQIDQTKLLNEATLKSMVEEKSLLPSAAQVEKPLDLATALNNLDAGVDAAGMDDILNRLPPPPAALEPPIDTRPPPPAALT